MTAACGALNNLPLAAMPRDTVGPVLDLLPSASGRSLEALASLLAHLVGRDAECDLLNTRRGADAILSAMSRLMPNNSTELDDITLKGTAQRAHRYRRRCSRRSRGRPPPPTRRRRRHQRQRR